MITVTTVVEYVFCPKFTYYINVLGLNQYEGKRGTVMAGKTLHSKQEKTNITYIPKDIEGRKLVSLQFYSKKYNFTGKIDEAIENRDEVILVERKYSDYVLIGPTINAQLGLLAILIEENIGKPVKKAIVIFSKKHRNEIIVDIDDKIKTFAIKMLENTRDVIKSGIIPPSNFDNRCLNCCFRKICPVGSLNTS